MRVRPSDRQAIKSVQDNANLTSLLAASRRKNVATAFGVVAQRSNRVPLPPGDGARRAGEGGKGQSPLATALTRRFAPPSPGGRGNSLQQLAPEQQLPFRRGCVLTSTVETEFGRLRLVL